MAKETAIYCRFSSDIQRDESLEEQQRQVRAGLVRIGIDHRDAEVITGAAISGTKADCPGSERLLSMIGRGEVDILAVDDQSRLSRTDNPRNFINDLVFAGGRFIAVDESSGTDQDGWRLRVKIIGVHKSHTVQKMGRRIHRGQKGRVPDDGSCGDYPYGYEAYYLDPGWTEKLARGRRPKKGHFICEPEAAVVRQMFDWYAAKWSTGDSTRATTEHDVPRLRRSDRASAHLCVGRVKFAALRPVCRAGIPATVSCRDPVDADEAMASPRSKLDEIVAAFATFEDPRSEINRRHPLPSVLVIAVLAVLAGAAGPTAIARWARYKEELLKSLLDLPHGVPGKDVFRRVLMTLKPEAFEAGFNARIARLRDEAAAATGVDRPIIAVDGKTARRSHDAACDLGALHVVTAWAGEYGLALGQELRAEKSNEITAIPELLRKIDVRGGIVTIDAIGAQKAIAGEVLRGKADYVLALKRNHESLHREVVEFIDEQPEGELEAAWELTTTERGHGREEERTYLQLPVPRNLPRRSEWKGLKSIGLVTSRRIQGGKENIEVRYDLSSLPVDVRLFARAVRGHWSVENACHWSLDVTFREDDSRVRERVLGSNITRLYRFTLSILKQHPDRRQSLIMKRRGCGWSDTFLMEVIGALTC